jgi:hypothetical protein
MPGFGGIAPFDVPQPLHFVHEENEFATHRAGEVAKGNGCGNKIANTDVSEYAGDFDLLQLPRREFLSGEPAPRVEGEITTTAELFEGSLDVCLRSELGNLLVKVGHSGEQLLEPALDGAHFKRLSHLQVPTVGAGLTLHLDIEMDNVRLTLAGGGPVGLHVPSHVVKRLRFPGAVSAVKHHLGDLGINESARNLLADALAKGLAPEIKFGVVRVDLGVNGERGAILQAEPFLEGIIWHSLFPFCVHWLKQVAFRQDAQVVRGPIV